MYKYIRIYNVRHKNLGTRTERKMDMDKKGEEKRTKEARADDKSGQ